MEVALREYKDIYLLEIRTDQGSRWYSGGRNSVYHHPYAISVATDEHGNARITKEPKILHSIDQYTPTAQGTLRSVDTTYTVTPGYYKENKKSIYGHVAKNQRLVRVVEIGFFVAQIQFHNGTKFVEQYVGIDRLEHWKLEPVDEVEWITLCLEK